MYGSTSIGGGSMSEAMSFFEKIMGNVTDGVNSCILGRIEKFNASTMKADISPLVKVRFKDGTLEDQSLLIDVPVSFLKAGPFVIRPPYKVGDMVVVVFADRDIENTLISGAKSEPNSLRQHSLDDAIVVGSLMPFNITLPGAHSDDLIIAKDDFSSKVVLKENGDIIIQGNNVFLGSDSALEGVPLGDTLKAWLDEHTHPAPGGETGSPSSNSPDPSQVVKTI